jgi:hypothetical protein
MNRADMGAWMAFYKARRGSGRGEEYAFAALCMQMLWRKSDEQRSGPWKRFCGYDRGAGKGPGKTRAF